MKLFSDCAPSGIKLPVEARTRLELSTAQHKESRKPAPIEESKVRVQQGSRAPPTVLCAGHIDGVFSLLKMKEMAKDIAVHTYMVIFGLVNRISHTLLLLNFIGYNFPRPCVAEKRCRCADKLEKVSLLDDRKEQNPSDVNAEAVVVAKIRPRGGNETTEDAKRDAWRRGLGAEADANR